MCLKIKGKICPHCLNELTNEQQLLWQDICKYTCVYKKQLSFPDMEYKENHFIKTVQELEEMGYVVSTEKSVNAVIVKPLGQHELGETSLFCVDYYNHDHERIS